MLGGLDYRSRRNAAAGNYSDPVAPAYLKTISDIINGDPVSLWRFINKAKHSAIRARTSTADLTDSINDAFNAATDEKVAVLTVPAGLYLMHAPQMRSSVTLRGAGSRVSTFKLLSGATTKRVIDVQNGAVGIHIAGLGFDDNDIVDAVCLYLAGVTDVMLADYFTDGNIGTYLIGTCDDVKIRGLRATGNYGVLTEPSSVTSNVDIAQSLFKDLLGDGVEINCPTGSARNWRVRGSSFDTIGNDTAAGFGVGASGGVNYIDGLDIDVCHFYRCDHQAVHIEDGVRNVNIRGGSAREIGYGSTQTFRAAVYAAATVAGREISELEIEGFRIYGGVDMQYGHYLGGTEAMTGVKVRGGSISKHLLYGHYNGSVVTRLSVEDLHVYNGAGPGIRQAASNAKYKGVQCYDTQGVKTQTYGLERVGGTDITYEDCDFKDNLTGAILTTTPGTREKFINNQEGATTNVTLKSGNKTYFDATDTEIGSAVPAKLNAQDNIGITGTVNDRAAGVNQVLNVTSASATPQLTGVVARAGTHLIIFNNSGVSFDIMHQNAGSAAANRFVLKAGADLTLASGHARQFFYTASRWNEI